MQSNIISRIKNELKQNADEKTKETGQTFFKEKVKFYGVKSAVVRKISNKYFAELKHKDKKEIFSLCENLLKSDYSEDAFIAFNWAYELRKKYEPADFGVFEAWIKKYVNNWAKCDVLCNHAVGSFIEQYPQFIKNLKNWTKSDNRWLRRASAVTLILPARHGLFLPDVFEIADKLLTDQDDLVQKGYGWMLKEASRIHQKKVFEYVMKNKKDMPRTALRYAIEKMPGNLKSQAMAK